MLINFNSRTVKKSKASSDNIGISLDRVAVIILGGGEGKRLAPLTYTRCKPAVSFGGRYSLIDVPISHSLSSGLDKIYVIGQYMAYTLQKHLFETYLNYGMQSQIQLLVPEERKEGRIWYDGTADAVRKNLNYFKEIQADYFLILSGDQLYNINFQDMIRYGLETDASMLIAAQPVKEKDAKRMGLMKLEEGGSKVLEFIEKPQDKAVLGKFKTDVATLENLGVNPSEGKDFIGSMGIYFFKKAALFDLLQVDKREDFGKHLICTEMKRGSVHAYLYDGYWEDIGTIESYYQANLALTQKVEDSRSGLYCYHENGQIITKAYNLPGAQIAKCQIDKALICEGSLIEAQEVTHSVIGVRSVLAQGAIIRDSLLMGNTAYSHDGEEVSFGIGENTLISKAIIDENVSIGNNVRLVNKQGIQEFDSPDGRIHVRDGIIIVPRGARIPDYYTF